MTQRMYDIVVHGATGYTGRLVAQYLAKSASATGIKWAICGRSKQRLEELAGSCIDSAQNFHKSSSCAPNKPAVLVADSTNPADLLSIAGSTRVVIACAGPFALVGKELVKACLDAGTHYVDITGEFPFVREIIEDFHTTAQQKKILIVPCCGFDCVPSDVANAFAFQLAAETGTHISRVEAAFRVKGSGASRGTLESVLNIKNAIRKRDMDPLSLVDDAYRAGVPTPAVKYPQFNRGFRSWVGPFLMAGANERIVRRSNSLIPERRTASYVEMVRGSFLQAVLSTLSIVFVALLFLPGVQGFFRKFVFPPPGKGPKATEGHWTVDVKGYSAASEPAVSGRLYCSLPPYPFTAVSVAEVALAIVAGETIAQGGVLTAVTAVGVAVKRRLAQSGYLSFTTQLPQQ